MAELIDKETIVDRMGEFYKYFDYEFCADDIYDALNELPTVEAEPTVHAHWIHTYDKYSNRVMMCSKCEAYFNEYHMTSAQISLNPDTFYCPTCGAKMDENGAKANETN